jgi:Fic family protein
MAHPGRHRTRFGPTQSLNAFQDGGEQLWPNDDLVRLEDHAAGVREDTTCPPLLTSMTFVFASLCIHPFRDGKGRVPRLLTTLRPQQSGFEVCPCVSLERLTVDVTATLRARLI